MSEFINTVDVLGDEALAASIIERSITEIVDSNTMIIGDYAFYRCLNLATINFPIASSVGNYSFYGCSELTSADFQLVTYLGNYAFDSCSKLANANFPALSGSVSARSFYYCSALTTAKFPLAKAVSSYAFGRCANLTNIECPNAGYIDNMGFYGCESLTKMNLPSVKYINTNAFYNCYNLVTIDTSALTDFIEKNAFLNCYALTTLVLRDATMVPVLKDVSALLSTPIADGTGYIYVPSALANSYKSATNWSTYANQIRALEDYTVDGTVTGELDKNKTEGGIPIA